MSIQNQLDLREMVDTTPLREKLMDLKNWEKTMKQKEKDLKAMNSVENATNHDSVPIRSKIRENGHSGDSPGGDSVQHINGDGPDNKSEVIKLAEERAISLKLACEEKERGNKLVSAKDYKSAIPHYAKAIELNPNDPAFFLNRALCRLRLDDYEAAIVDCDAALKLDKSLTKAYFRRMQSNTKLERYDDALGDCLQMIRMDSKNPDLRKEFDRIKQLKIDKESGKTAALLKKKKEEEEVVWEPKPKKLWSKFGVDEEEVRFQDKAPHLRSKKPLKRIKIEETFTAPEPIETFPDYIVDKLFNNFTGESTSNGPVASSSRSPTALFSPYTPLYGSFGPKSPVIPTPPSPMSSSALNLSSCDADRSIDDIFGGMSIAANKSQADDKIIPLPPPPPAAAVSSTSSDDKTDLMKPVPLPPSPNQPVTEYSIPKTGVQFSNLWKGMDETQRFHFLKQCQEKSTIVERLGASLDDSLFSEILDCLHTYFCAKDLNIGDILQQLSHNSEISILAMMMGQMERRQVDDLISYVRNRQEISEELCAEIEKAFSG